MTIRLSQKPKMEPIESTAGAVVRLATTTNSIYPPNATGFDSDGEAFSILFCVCLKTCCHLGLPTLFGFQLFLDEFQSLWSLLTTQREPAMAYTWDAHDTHTNAMHRRQICATAGGLEGLGRGLKAR